jgi:hypothetical protein
LVIRRVEVGSVSQAGLKDASRDVNLFQSNASSSSSPSLTCTASNSTQFNNKKITTVLPQSLGTKLTPGGALGPSGKVQTISVTATKPCRLSVNPQKATPKDAQRACGVPGKLTRGPEKDTWDIDKYKGSVFRTKTDDGKVYWNVENNVFALAY